MRPVTPFMAIRRTDGELELDDVTVNSPFLGSPFPNQSILLFAGMSIDLVDMWLLG
jgi:hypothetical protein